MEYEVGGDYLRFWPIQTVVIGAYGGNRQGEIEEWNVALVVRASQRFQDIYNVAWR